MLYHRYSRNVKTHVTSSVCFVSTIDSLLVFSHLITISILTEIHRFVQHEEAVSSTPSAGWEVKLWPRMAHTMHPARK